MGCKGRFDTALMYKYMIKTVVQPHVKSFIPLNLSDWLKYTSACIDVCTFTSDIKNVHVCIAVALTGVPEGINIQCTCSCCAQARTCTCMHNYNEVKMFIPVAIIAT